MNKSDILTLPKTLNICNVFFQVYHINLLKKIVNFFTANQFLMKIKLRFNENDITMHHYTPKYHAVRKTLVSLTTTVWIMVIIYPRVR